MESPESKEAKSCTDSESSVRTDPDLSVQERNSSEKSAACLPVEESKSSLSTDNLVYLLMKESRFLCTENPAYLREDEDPAHLPMQKSKSSLCTENPAYLPEDETKSDNLSVEENGHHEANEASIYFEVVSLPSSDSNENVPLSLPEPVFSQESKGSSKKKLCIVITTLFAVLTVLLLVILSVFGLEISAIASRTQHLNTKETLGQKSLSSNFEVKLNSSVENLLETLLADAILTRSVITSLQQQVYHLENKIARFLVFSCAVLPPSSPSGYYWVRASSGSAVRVYCDMTRSCGGVTGGWTRVFELDMTNSSQQCPSGLRLNDSNLRTCRHNSDEAGCSQVILPTSRLQYSRVCGRIKAYQVGTPDTFGGRKAILGINDAYVDGVSLTHGNPRQHIWTFAAGHDESSRHPLGNCPCANNGTAFPPLVVADDYFCDTGSSSRFQYGFFYSSDPLWDGAGCGPLNSCCSFNTPPWFYKQLLQPTTDDIELRVCRDQNLSDEDIALEKIDIYIQ